MNLKTVYECPAYKILETPVDYRGRKAIRVNDKVALMDRMYKGAPLPVLYRAGSVAAYAIENNECPIEKVERAKARGENLYWLNECSVSLSATKRPQETVYLIEVGMEVYMQGKAFRIEKVRKGGPWLKLVEIEPAAAAA